MDIEIDPDVKAVAAFMQGNMAASKLVAVAASIGRLAPILWGHHASEQRDWLVLSHLPITSDDDPHTRSDANE